MTACNARPPEGHPLHDWGVACHLPEDHLKYEEPHAWDIDAAVARHEIIRKALDGLRELRPGQRIARFDSQLPHPIVAYDVDADGERVSEPYRMWDTPAGPWLCVTFESGEEFAIWKTTGHVYHVGKNGAVDEDPIITP